MKPSDVQNIIPQMSPLLDFNAERGAMWTAQALAATGDKWRKISWEEIEPMLSEWTESDRRTFKRHLINLDSEEKAIKIWDTIISLSKKRGVNLIESLS